MAQSTQRRETPGAASDWLEHYVTDLAVTRPYNTVRAYRADLVRWLKFCEESGVDALRARPRDIIGFIQFERGREKRGGGTVGARTVVRRLAAIRRWYEYLALEPELTGVTRNPVSGGGTLRTAASVVSKRPALLRFDTALPDTLTGDEMTGFINALKTHRDRAIVWVLKDGGVRIHEVLGLQVGNIDWAGHRIKVVSTKGRAERMVQLSEESLIALGNYIRLERPKNLTHDFAFVCLGRRSYGNPFNYRAWVYICEQARESAGTPDVHAHAFRHTFATNLAEAGMPLDALQRQLGHRRHDSTLIYTRVRDGRLQREYRQAMRARSDGKKESDRT